MNLSYYDRQGNQITDQEYYTLFSDPEYQSIGKTVVGNYMISTVWLGLDHGYTGRPMIFETMVFPDETWDEVECERYATEDAAIRGHFKMVVKFMGEFPDEAEVERVGQLLKAMVEDLG